MPVPCFRLGDANAGDRDCSPGFKFVQNGRDVFAVDGYCAAIGSKNEAVVYAP